LISGKFSLALGGRGVGEGENISILIWCHTSGMKEYLEKNGTSEK